MDTYFVHRITIMRFLILCAVFLMTKCERLLVDIAQGTVQGQNATDGDYVTFFGIPYAGNVDGENRFKAAPPAPSLQRLFIANNPNIACAQPTPHGLVGEENCLVINIMTKNTTGPRPVMVWINGNHFTSGTNQGFNFRRFVENEDILVVTLNYRLSIFGFLCLGIEDAPGNAGLKDVISGLRWVRDNIAAFGGDPNNVLLAGHGSGAVMVDLITLSPLANGLVHKAIVQSGNSLSPWAISYDPIGNAKSVSAVLGYEESNVQDLAINLRNTELSLLETALNNFSFTNNIALFAPCIENEIESTETVLTEAPIDIIRSGNYADIPMIIGYTNREGTLRADEAMNNDWLKLMDSNFDIFIQPDINIPNDIVNDIRRYYFDERSINFDCIEDYLDYHGDTMVLLSSIRAAAERAKTSKAAVRLYEFGFIGDWSAEWPYPIKLNGARHGHELVYLFETGIVGSGGSINERVRDSLTRRWANFARDSNPEVNTTSGRPWPKVKDEIEILEYVQVTENVNFEVTRLNPHEQRMTFWNDIYEHYYVPPRPVSSANHLVLNFILSFSFIKLNYLINT